MKRIVICADGTWNRPEKDLKKDSPTNVLKVARGIAPRDSAGTDQVVFYDWGVGSYYGSVKGGALGEGINKNIMDSYRFIVQNYDIGDDLYFFGFSRGAYTVRSLSGFIYNCGILKRSEARRIQQAFDLYKDRKIHPKDETSVNFRRKYSIGETLRIRFVGVWDTVGALGIPVRMLGFLNEKHLFHDTKIGPNVDIARHALAIDEMRSDFKPTIWKQRTGLDLQQVWFAGVHSDVGGGYKPDRSRRLLSDIPLQWMIGEAEKSGLQFERHLQRGLKGDPLADKHEEYDGFYKILGKRVRRILKSTPIHHSVKERYDKDETYRPKALERYLKKNDWSRA
ncbi:MAG: DUF2235 domain-containing protein [FCB group bacterium]|nr:DUF2235 domain-containing protein [FCB group bacterium]